jgi:hypothetical protein
MEPRHVSVREELRLIRHDAPRQEPPKGMVDAVNLFGGEHALQSTDLGDPTGNGGRSWRGQRRQRAATAGERGEPNHLERSRCLPRATKPRVRIRCGLREQMSADHDL